MSMTNKATKMITDLPDQSKVVILAALAVLVTKATTKAENMTNAVVVLIILTALSVYNTQCLVKGNCSIWAWISTTSFVLMMFQPNILDVANTKKKD